MTRCETCGKEEREHAGHGRHPSERNHLFLTFEKSEEDKKLRLTNAALTLRENCGSPVCAALIEKLMTTKQAVRHILADDGFCERMGKERYNLARTAMDWAWRQHEWEELNETAPKIITVGTLKPRTSYMLEPKSKYIGEVRQAIQKACEPSALSAEQKVRKAAGIEKEKEK